MKVIETTDFFFVARNIAAVTKDLSDDKSLMVCPCGSMSKEDAFHDHCPSRKVRDEFYNKLLKQFKEGL